MLRPRVLAAPSRTRLASESGEHKSGHISRNADEGILFFNCILPFNLQWFYRLSWTLQRRRPILLQDAKDDNVGAVSPGKVVQDATKDSSVGNVEVVEVLPRLKEGGAFLKFRLGPGVDAQAVTAAVRSHLRENPIRPWWNPFSNVGANLVIGKPWIEDLYIFPSSRLRVEFLPPQPGQEAAEMSQEQLYSFFRPYGKLANVISQPSDSKIVPRYAYLDYAQARKAVMAKNCLHGFTIPEQQGGGKSGTLLRITYEKKDRWGWIKDWIVNHPRIAIPLFAALIAGISYTIFDPLRTLSIEAHITRAFHVEDTFVFKWFRRQSVDLINKVKQLSTGHRSSEASMQALWEDRRNEVEQIQSWLMESSDTFIVVLGPRGSGKKELVVDHALEHKREARKLLVIDCKPVQEARGDAATIAAAAAQVGYRPVFSWINNISGLIDLAAQGMTGIKAGFSETLETQLVKIHNNTAVALRKIALQSRKKTDVDANLTDEEFLEAHPEHRPVVVVDNFLHKNNEPGAQVVYDKIADWAAELTTSYVAHVVFLTNDIAFTKSLSKALPDRVFRQIALADCSPEVAKRYVINHLDFDLAPDLVVREEKDDGEATNSLTASQKRQDLSELDSVIGQLGGRLTDLDFLARRIKAGETPTVAVKEIINQSASEVLKMYLTPSTNEERHWTSQQAWTLVKKLSQTDTLPYNELLLDASFSSGGDAAIAALEQAELITVQSTNGRAYSVKPGKPVYQQAFQRLVEDRVLAAKMDLALANDATGSANKSIDRWEQELRLLGELPKQPGELHARVEWLLGNVAAAQRKIEALEKETAGLKKVLMSEY
ncbi:RNA12 protein-domain-containing protein [Neohortaea acidophila]|uniref:Mitochondrial escape protein 2 n=1 Tax=Neohortaea acidophila TaxID=245834 RepID=A0A6A6PF58_9PEZI|nr:RNA12 protein-domain-containing protein [Neohortaea acidophila]KAF2478582.1 RNA12 protein-domain-containing protein [Neohortaea acidophila]